MSKSKMSERKFKAAQKEYQKICGKQVDINGVIECAPRCAAYCKYSNIKPTLEDTSVDTSNTECDNLELSDMRSILDSIIVETSVNNFDAKREVDSKCSGACTTAFLCCIVTGALVLMLSVITGEVAKTKQEVKRLTANAGAANTMIELILSEYGEYGDGEISNEDIDDLVK